MQSTHHNQLRRKRDAYRRSKTLAALPYLQARGITVQQQQQQGIESSSSAAEPSCSQPVLSRSFSRSSRSSVGSTSVDLQFTPPPPSQATTSKTTSQVRLLGRTPSSPSMLLSRMRELFREKVVETTVNRSDLAAMERERRQRAADAFVETLRRRQRQQHHQHRHSSGSVDASTASGLTLSSSVTRRGGSRRHRIRSDPVSSWPRRCSPASETLMGEIPLQTISSSTNVAKNAFREHRSTSEDMGSRRHRTTATFGRPRRRSDDVAIGHRSKGYLQRTA